MPAEFSLGELAVQFGLTLRGEPGLKIHGVATLSHAEPGSLSFLANSRYRRQLSSTRATAVIVSAEDEAHCPCAALIHPNPYLAYARIASLMHPPASAAPGIHRSAVVSAAARIPPSASIGPLAVVEDDADIGERVSIGPGCIVQRGVRIGADSILVSRVNLYPGVSLGQRCILHAGAVIGADGFGFAANAGTWVKVPQVGSVRIGDDVEVGANTSIDRGAIDDTVVEDGVKLDNQIQVGHNVLIGAHTAIAACTGISGSTVIGRRCMIGGMVGFAGHLSIADDVVVTGCSLVSASIKQAGSYSSGMPTVETRLWRRMVAHLRRLDG
ncbi:MAG TPA: UDP-3-O-(3-hydroxymyristoyl)glucosamine N-acyltransferase [Steroidobacteraceae bacterium]|nr:UDP-3-O-(3-hydroxymyristoyl)glucosamine N-acyltransferase [Steroidobacteraceae bacterium]